MKLKLALLVFPSLLTISAYAATQPVVAYTFECKNGQFQGEGPCPQGGRPDSLIQGSDGNFYGTTEDSMEGSSTPTGGTVFSVTPAGKFTLLHTFAPGAGNDYPDGNLPGSLAEGPDGKLYGSTLFGGVGGCNGYCGGGVMYRINRNGTGFEIIHQGCSETNCADGGVGAMIAAPDGSLYGTSATGGTGNCVQGCGTIFRVTPATGAYEVVVNFDSTTGGAPGGLILAADGTFYGMNFFGSNEGIVHFTPSTGKVNVVAVNFPLINGLPSRGGGIIFGRNGNLFGIYHIYATPGLGIFEVHADGSDLQLLPFFTTKNGGGSPDGLVLATDGNFWMADYNGLNGYGDIVKISPTTGKLLNRLQLFGASAAVGAYPAEIIQTSDGKFWGSTYGLGKSTAGHFADGTVFSLNLGLPAK